MGITKFEPLSFPQNKWLMQAMRNSLTYSQITMLEQWFGLMLKKAYWYGNMLPVCQCNRCNCALCVVTAWSLNSISPSLSLLLSFTQGCCIQKVDIQPWSQMGLRQSVQLHGISVLIPEGLWLYPCSNALTQTSATANPAWPDRSLDVLG